MARPTKLSFPIEKAVYLLTRETESGKGGDKKKFWREILGFDSPELVRESILDSLQVNDLAFNRPSRHGDRYQAVSLVRDIAGSFHQVKTAWIVHPEETTARFVTAFPQRRRG